MGFLVMEKIKVKMYLYAWHHDESDTINYSLSTSDGMDSQGYVLLGTTEAVIDKPDFSIYELREKIRDQKIANKQKLIDEMDSL